MRIHLIAVNEKMVAVKDGAFEPGLMEQHLQHALATARYIAGNVSTQLMLKTLFEIIATMADDPDKYRSDMRKKLLELADTMSLAPMTAVREKMVFAGGQILSVRVRWSLPWSDASCSQILVELHVLLR